MKNLERYLEEKINFWNRHTNRNELKLPLTDSEADQVLDSLEGNLSPENLHCDGEISRAAAQRKYNYFMRVHSDLERHMGRRLYLSY